MKLKSFFKNKITYFDFFFGIVFLVAIIVIFLLFYRKTEYVNIRVKITDQDVLYAYTDAQTWYANRFEAGDKEMDELGGVISQVTSVETFNTSINTKAVYLNMRIKAVYDKRTKLYSAKGINLVFGNTIKFNFPNVAFNALITESPSTINQNGLTIEERRITVLIRGPDNVEPKLLEKIKKGDTITDSNGNTLAKVEDITLRPGQRITQTSRGDLLLKQDPYFKDAIINLSVRVKKYKGDSFIFDTTPLKLGSAVPLNFSYETIFPIIIDIK